MIKIVDAKGKKCPLPIILTKKCIDQSQVGDVIEVILDNEISKCNLVQYVQELGIEAQEQSNGDQTIVRFVLGGKLPSVGVEDINCPIPSKIELDDYVIVFGKDQMGDGEKELGETLIRTYINTLTELNTYPSKIIFYNSGVKLVSQGADTIESLSKLASFGVEILICGVCVDYYNIKIAVGSISNMFAIGNVTASASKVIYP